MSKTGKTLRKIVSFAAAAFMLVQTAVICSAETDVRVTYNALEDSITANLVTTRSETRATLTVKKDGRYFVITDFTRTGSTFSKTFKMPADAPSGEYEAKVTIGGESDTGSFSYVNPRRATVAMTTVNAATPETFATAIGATYSDLAVNYEKFQTHQEKITELYFKYKANGNLTAERFAAFYPVVEALSEIAAESDDVAAEALIGAKAALIGFDYDTFADEEELSDAERAQIVDFFQAANYTESTLATQYDHWFCLAGVNVLFDSSVSTYREALFVTYDSVLSLDKTAYDVCADQDEVIRLVMDNKTYDSVSGIRAAFAAAVATVGPAPEVDEGEIEEDDDDEGGYTGGGFGGAIGTPNWNDTSKKDNDKKEDINKEETTKPVINTTGFSDVLNDHWCASQIATLYNKGIINGAGDGKFLPDNTVTRAEFSKMLVNALFADYAETKNAEFTDVSADAWYYEYVNKAVDLGIVMGSDGAFMPNETISRQDMAIMVYRAFEKLGVTLPSEGKTFADDSSVAEYAKSAVAALAGNGILNGMEDGNFMPTGKLNRAQAAKVLYEALKAAVK